MVFMLIPMLHDHKREVHGQILTEVAGIIEAGHLRPVLDDLTFSLEEVGKAHDRLASGQGLGKVVIDI